MNSRIRNAVVLVGFTGVIFSVGLTAGYGMFSSSDDIIKTEQHVEEMITTMNNDHSFTMKMMTMMIEDPTIRIQMLGHMTENHDALQQMRELVSDD